MVNYTSEFRADVVAVARKGEVPLRQLAKDFGTGKSTLHLWLRAAESGSLSVKPLKAEVMRRAVAYFSEGVNPK